MIKISVLITVLNEEENLPRCLDALKDFNEIIVIDSGSQDKTLDIAKNYGANIIHFKWNGAYPKKRQWCLDNIGTKNDYIFFVDADEELTLDLIEEIKNLDFKKSGYFIKGQYNWRGQNLKHGLKNNKLVLFDKDKFEFPVINDLGNFCMGEMEGHYQPILKKQYKNEKIGQLNAVLNHFAYDDAARWGQRHARYATWEAGMINRKLYPKENNKGREILKIMFRNLPCRGAIAFIHSYIYELGFMDGRAGFEFALSRFEYYQMVKRALITNKAMGKNGVNYK